jgi:hypothetical protein
MDETSMPESDSQKAARLRPAEDVVARRLEDSIVLVNLRTNLIFELNVTSARLWELIVEGCDRGELERRMSQEFDVDDKTLGVEITTLLDSLREAGLVTADVDA